MTPDELRRPKHLWLEYAAIPLIIGCHIYALGFLFINARLPQPYFYEPWGPFMDWYSLVGFARNGGAYDVGGTIYPPLSFVLLKIFSFPACYKLNDAEWARSCDWIGFVALGAILAINVVLTFRTFYKWDRTTYLPRAFAISLGMPMLFTLERGNLLLFCYACVLLAFGPLLRSAWLRWLFAGLAVNFKIYLIGALVAPLLHRRWRAAEMMLISAAAIYMLSFAILSEGSPAQILRNLTSYSAGFGSTRLNDLWYPGSMIPAITLLEGNTFPIGLILHSTQSNILLLLAKSIMRGTQLIIMLAAAATWLRPEAVPRQRMIFFAIAMATITSEAGGYTEMLLLIFVMMERWRGIGRPMAIMLAYMLSIPAEYAIDAIPPVMQASFWAGGKIVYGSYGIGVLSLLRPLLQHAVIWALAAVTLRDVAADIWEQRWKERWRYRADMPILVGAGRARQPQRD